MLRCYNHQEQTFFAFVSYTCFRWTQLPCAIQRKGVRIIEIRDIMHLVTSGQKIDASLMKTPKVRKCHSQIFNAIDLYHPTQQRYMHLSKWHKGFLTSQISSKKLNHDFNLLSLALHGIREPCGAKNIDITLITSHHPKLQSSPARSILTRYEERSDLAHTIGKNCGIQECLGTSMLEVDSSRYYLQCPTLKALEAERFFRWLSDFDALVMGCSGGTFKSGELDFSSRWSCL